MPRYFMSDTRLGWLEKMMMAPFQTISAPYHAPAEDTPEEAAV